MPQVQAQRRLVKSPPELWSELSDAEALARHLGEFGEIRITRLEPETKVVWEGEHASGSAEIEASGWGTKVILTVDLADPDPEPEPEPEPAPEPEPEPPVLTPISVAAQRRGFLARFFSKDDRVDTVIEQARETVEEETPAPAPAPEPAPEPEPEPAADTTSEQQLLETVLDALGQAHHRPFSRA